jgi:dodecin
MSQSTRKAIDPQSTYDVVELIGTSTESWEDAAKNVIEQAAEHLRELRVAEVLTKDMVIRNGKVEAYRTKVKVSFKYEGHG